jgi:secreted trypsin-like serine protease
MVLNGSLRNNKITFSHVTSEMFIHKNDTYERLSFASCRETDFDFDFCASHHGCHESLMCDKNCKGDSGLPILTETGEVVGLVSGGPENCQRNAVPGGYVSLYAHKQFIIRSIEFQSSDRRTASEIETRALSGAEKQTLFVSITLVLLTLICL